MGFPEKIRDVQTSDHLSELPIGLDANFPFLLLVLLGRLLKNSTENERKLNRHRKF